MNSCKKCINYFPNSSNVTERCLIYYNQGVATEMLKNGLAGKCARFEGEIKWFESGSGFDAFSAGEKLYRDLYLTDFRDPEYWDKRAIEAAKKDTAELFNEITDNISGVYQLEDREKRPWYKNIKLSFRFFSRK